MGGGLQRCRSEYYVYFLSYKKYWSHTRKYKSLLHFTESLKHDDIETLFNIWQMNITAELNITAEMNKLNHNFLSCAKAEI